MFIRGCGGRKKSEKFVATEGTISVTTNISGASISIMDGSKVVASGSAVDGKPLTTGKIPNGTYVVTVSKEGYKPYTQSVIVNGTDETVDVKLEEVKPEEVKAALKDAIKIRETKVQVNFTNKIAVPTKDNFSIDGLTITDVALSEDQKSVILTVSDKLELDKTYAVSTKNIVDANGEAVTDGTVDFTARKVEYTAVMQITDPKTGEVKNELKSDGADTAKVEVTLYDNANHIVKDDAEMTFTATAGNFAEKKVTVQNGVASILFTSEISSKKIESLLTATVTESSNAELKNTKAERRISLNPNIEGQKDQTVGASLTDVMVETCDRVVLFFNKDVDVTNYTKNTDEEKYAYDSNRMEIKILDNAKTLESIPDGAGTISPKALIPVKDNPKALCAILDTDEKSDYLTDNAKAIVKVTDKTKTIPVTETKSTIVTDIRTPSILDVKQNGLRSIDVIFSEPVQNSAADGNRTNSAEIVHDKDTDKWVIDTRTLSDDSWGVAPKRAKAEVGKFDVKTGEDRRNVVTITLGKKANGDQIYFKAGKHSVQGNKIGDWANVTDTNNNFINTQTLDFTIEADETAPKMDVKVESPEQYYVTFNTDVDANKVKANLKLQQYKDNTWKNIDDINIRPVGTSQKEFIVELTKDWTDKDILDTYTSKKNYYNYNFRLHMDEKVLTNLSNGLKNAEINYNLDDAIMKNPDVTSPKLKDVTQNGQKNVKIEFSEPAQIKMENDHQITPKAEQGDLSLPIIQFISEDNSKTIKGKVEKVDDHDTSIYVVPDGESLTAGTWKVVVRNVSDDIGNTAETLVKNDFVVKGDIPADTGFRVRWIVAVPEGNKDPITGETYAKSDVIYVKFNKQIKTYGNAANAGATTNYTVNDYPLPTSKIDAFIDEYNKPASNYAYSDIVAIHLKDTALTASSNTININKTLESAAGAKLDNGGKFLLSKVNGDAGNYIFTWNYKDYSDNKSMTVSDVQKLLDNEEYNTLKFSKGTISDLNSDKTTFKLTHSGTVDFDGQKVHELTINTMETGILEVKNIKADKVTVYAPYAEVIINNASINHAPTDPADIGELDVEDVLNGTLTLSNSTVDTLKVTDSNEGKIRLEGANTAIKTAFVIDTTGEITLEVADGFDVSKLPTAKGVEITKACTLHVKDDGATRGSNTIKITVASEEVAKKVTITEDKDDLVSGSSNVTVKAEDAKAVEITEGKSVNGADATTVNTPATTKYKIVTNGAIEVKGATTGGISVVTVGDEHQSLSITKGETPAQLAKAISELTFKDYNVNVDSDKVTLIFTSKVKGTKAKAFVVSINYVGVEGLAADATVNGKDSNCEAGKDNQTGEAATPGSSSFTVSGTGKNVAGKIVVTIDDDTIKEADKKTFEVEVGAFDEIATIAGKFSSELNNKTELAKLYFVETAVDEKDSKKYTITFKTGTSEKPTTGKEAVAPKVTVKFVAK